LLQEKSLHSWVIVAYAHTVANPNDIAKYQFYDMFSDLVVTIPARDVMLKLGDFNAQISYDFSNWKGIIGQHNFPTKDDLPTKNGMRLLSFYRHHRLTITSTFF
jgi:hypothetical protein